jgi:putative FmdB family regulatory protein
VPTYEYQCTNCGKRIEAVQSFSADALTHCDACDSDNLRKLFGNVGVVFKGSGFYRNDARTDDRAKSAKATGSESAGSETSTPTDKSEGKTSESAKSTSDTKTPGKSTAKPAAKAE